MKGYQIVQNRPSITWVDPKLINHRIDSHFFSTNFINEYSHLLNSGLEIYLLDKICYRMNSGPFGSALLASQYVSEGIPFVRPINCKDYIVSNEEFVYISEEDNKRLKSSNFRSGALLITKIGNGIGDVAIVPQHISECNISGNLMGVTVKRTYDSYYVLAFLKSKYGQKQIIQARTNSAKPKIDMESIKNISIALPDKRIQTYIGNKVRKAEELREKANKNRREYMSLIDNYFSNVSKDKFPKGSFIINCQNIDSKSQRLDASFYNPIYKEYENLDIEYKKLGDLVKVKTNINPKSDVDYFYYEIGDMSNNVILDKEETIKGKNLPSRAKLNLSKYDIIVSLVQESIEVTSFVDIDRENMLTTNGCAVLAPKDISIAGYLYAIVSSPYFIAQKCRYISGTNIRSLSKEDLLQIPIPIFEYKIIEKINDLVKDEYYSLRLAKQLIREAKQDVEDLIEGKFDESKISEGV